MERYDETNEDYKRVKAFLLGENYSRLEQLIKSLSIIENEIDNGNDSFVSQFRINKIHRNVHDKIEKKDE